MYWIFSNVTTSVAAAIITFRIILFFRYETLVDTIDKKFQSKKRKTRDTPENLSSDSESDEDIRALKKRARRGFLKPKVD